MCKFTRYYTILVLLIFFLHQLAASLAALHLTPTIQKFALFQFKLSLTISAPANCYYYSFTNDYKTPSHPRTMNWSMSSDYCTWEGVSCEHKTGDVIGLDLSCSQLEGAILPNSTLFQLSHLRSLNLFGNDFSLSNRFPKEFGFFAKGLTHLNLSSTRLSGRAPSGISHLYKLVSLDLSYNYGAKLEDEVFKSLLQNLTLLRVLNLEGVDISSVLPVNFSTSLRVLNLGSASLHGVVPQEVFHLPNLEVLVLYPKLSGEVVLLTTTLPKVKWGSSATLQQLYLIGINIYGGLPDSIGFLESLGSLALPYCNLSGPIPRSIGHLGQLTYLALNDNNLNGPIPTDLANLTNLRILALNANNFAGSLPRWLFDHPSLEALDLGHNGFRGQLHEFDASKLQLTYFDCTNNQLNGPIPQSFSQLLNLTELDFSSNNFSGPFPYFVAHTRKLVNLYLSNNGFTGSLPRWLFQHPSLEALDLGHNGFRGQLHEFDSSKSQLQVFDCSNNQLNGPIPKSFSQLLNLTELNFSSNNFSGVLDFKMFSRLEYLGTLDLSHNSLSVRNATMITLPPNLGTLGLSSCNMKEFPHFSRDSESSLYRVDLSNNHIDGEISHSIRLVGWNPASYLNLSHNRLTGGLEQLPWNNVTYLDLQSNMLEGSLPNLICNSSSLEILNLSHNNLSGVLPDCSKNLTSIKVFDLRMNKIQGNIPATLSNFRGLETINLNGNKLEGRIPSSFAEFDYLKVLDLGSNHIHDTFPQCLEGLPNLQVLVLKSNKFHGIINKSSKVEHPFSSLRIIDLSYNEFSGPLPAIYFKNFKAMMNADVNKIERSYMGDNTLYSDSTILVIKGVETELMRILTIFTTIDVSKNNFEGEIVEYMGNLVSLRYLNLSHNHLTGYIPAAIGKLSMMESLDLSFNRLEGEIPPQLTSIYSLARLNLSGNQLTGHIPEGSQFNTFENDSYVGNLGLCGHPLSKECKHDIESQKEGENDEDDDYFFSGFTWEAVVIGYGCGVVPAFIIGNLMLLAGKPKWFFGIIARELGLKVRRMEIKWR